jgi:hypothetical protein
MVIASTIREARKRQREEAVVSKKRIVVSWWLLSLLLAAGTLGTSGCGSDGVGPATEKGKTQSTLPAPPDRDPG